MWLPSKRNTRPLFVSTIVRRSIASYWSYRAKTPLLKVLLTPGGASDSRPLSAVEGPRPVQVRAPTTPPVSPGASGNYAPPVPWLLHHVHIAIPPGSEAKARQFYRDVLGCGELAKPATLAGQGGAWFRYGAVELHLGIEEGHRPAQRAHPGILVGDLDEVEAKLRTAGYEVEPDFLLPGYRRFYVSDPFGNRLEFLAVL